MFRILILIVAGLATPLAAQTATDTRVPESRMDMQMSFAPVVEATASAVVNIYASRTLEQRSPFQDDPFFSQFFKDFVLGPREQNSLGSGVILGEGLVVTNFHVVGNADDIRVVLADRREYAGTMVLADEFADLAVIRLENAPDLPALEFADSDGLRVGDLVLAIGNPFGVGQTVSSGIVSGLARSGQGGGAMMQGGRYFIQTDAPINPGNSGGALVDMEGRLVGINTQIVTRSGGSNGIGFAIPAALVKQVVDQAAAGNDRFTRPYSGVEVQVVDAAMAEALGLDRPMGVILRRLADDSPFAEAGLVPGDVIVAIEDQPVNAAAELDFRLATHPLGESVAVRYVSGGSWQGTEVALVPAPEGPELDLVTIAAPGPFQGLTVAPMSPEIGAATRNPYVTEGLFVVEVEGRAARTGFQRGDVILTVNRIGVRTAADLEAVVTGQSGWWRVDYLRGNRQVTARFNG
ncbi:trypsin-like peptidase domain-containing protein [Maritimibacter sp. DP1N21-5]|uniref:trypsin-like peptidase domain-containing protein n=1 Tax=Maritimibacter sp. DP1N21-5 TaxID=2836867 RepID=UPI001C47CBD8|nr:trypsin-like peptidase domain-containing protein [Maritimibacter sp. DP1N21-5]MBV7407763.1 trypsin-like peptidase domain-containing protein [Maritimibacter sp. DP1N21-5]